MISKKIILIGDFAVGKTSLICRFVDNQFSDSYLSTIGVKISKKEIPLEPKSIRGLIWDIEGGTPNKPVNTTYITGAHGCILVADITRDETLEHIATYIDMVRHRDRHVPCVLVLNKSDLMSEEERDSILLEAKRQYDQSVEAFFLSSAKTGEGVERMFHMLAEMMLERG